MGELMNVRKRSGSLLITLSLIAALCPGAQVRANAADKPRDEAFRTVIRKETSTLNIPIEATAEELARIVNKTAPIELYQGSTRTRGLTAHVVRNAPITISAADNYLYITLPVSLSLSYGMFSAKAIPLKLKFKATASVTPDWMLHTEITYMGLSDLLVEEVGAGPLSLKPRSIIEGFTQPLQKVLSDLVAQKINELFPLKAQILRVWNTAQKPVLLDRNYNAWLKLTPREVLLSPLYARNNRVKLSIGINTLAELLVGPEPVAQPLLQLPDLRVVSSFDKTFRIALSADLSYRDLRAALAPLLLNKQFDSDGKTVVVKDFDLYGNGDKLVIKLETQGSLDGVFYLTARPSFNPQTKMFSVEDVDFDMQTRSLLLKTADWFLHGAIRSMIQDRLNLNLANQLEQSRQMAEKALVRIPLMGNMFMKGDIKTLTFKDVIVQQEKISIQLYSEGESTVFFQ